MRWATLGGLAAGACVSAYLAGAQSLATASVRTNAIWAASVAPWNAVPEARQAREIVLAVTQDAAVRGIDKSRLARAEALARSALAREGLSIDAVLALGMAAQFRDETPLARRYLNYAKLLSKRELQVQLWAIEDAVGRNDIDLALRQYDIALRTSRNGRDLLFPILAGAISDPAIRVRTVKLIQERPYWAPDFVFSVARQGEPRISADLIRRLQQNRFPLPEGALAILIERLIEVGASDEAWSFYAGTHPGARRDRSRDPQFSDNGRGRSSFDWQLFGDGGNVTSIERGDESNILAFAVAAGPGGLLARQTQLLTPGRYVLHGRGTPISGPESAIPFWEVRCADGRVLMRAPLSVAGRQVSFTEAFSVPEGCRTQLLSLIGPPNGTGNSIEGEVHAIEIRPAA